MRQHNAPGDKEGWGLHNRPPDTVQSSMYHAVTVSLGRSQSQSSHLPQLTVTHQVAAAAANRVSQLVSK